MSPRAGERERERARKKRVSQIVLFSEKKEKYLRQLALYVLIYEGLSLFPLLSLSSLCVSVPLWFNPLRVLRALRGSPIPEIPIQPDATSPNYEYNPLPAKQICAETPPQTVIPFFKGIPNDPHFI